MLLTPGSVPIRPWGHKRRPAAGGVSPRRRRPEEAQSGAYAPLQRRPTRPLPISRGPSPPLPTTHTLTRVGGPTGPCRWPSLSTAETTAMTTHVVSLRPLILSTRPPPPACWQSSGLDAPNHSVARQDKQLTPRLRCPCARDLRRPGRGGEEMRADSFVERVDHAGVTGCA